MIAGFFTAFQTATAIAEGLVTRSVPQPALRPNPNPNPNPNPTTRSMP